MRNLSCEGIAFMSGAWAVLRIGLGLAQVMGATVAFSFLLTIGLAEPTLWATGVTLFLTILSRLIFAKSGQKQ